MEAVQTKGVEVHPIIFYTNPRPIRFIIWEMTGQDKFQNIRQLLYKDGKCCIIMFSLTHRCTYMNTLLWHHNMTATWPNIPVVIVGNKEDHHNFKSKTLTSPRKINLPFCNISVKTTKNFKMPFLWLARKMTGDNKLHFVGLVAPQPPAFPIYAMLNNSQLKEAAGNGLPN
jgi:GTP-binding nuclear protein Ran